MALIEGEEFHLLIFSLDHRHDQTKPEIALAYLPT